jgi:hypothetical protein
LAGRSGAGEKRLDLPQLLARLEFSRYPAASLVIVFIDFLERYATDGTPLPAAPWN